MLFRSLSVICVAVFAYFPITAHAGSQLELIRNSDVESLDPVTPPVIDLFDETDGGLLGVHIAQPYDYTLRSEPIEGMPGDGPLILYRLNDSSQSLFLTKLNDAIVLMSYIGDCEPMTNSELFSVAPQFTAESVRAAQQYPGACCPNTRPTGIPTCRSSLKPIYAAAR